MANISATFDKTSFSTKIGINGGATVKYNFIKTFGVQADVLYSQMGSPEKSTCIIPLHIRTINKQIKLYAAKAGIRGKRISSHTMRKTFGRICWDRNNQSEACLVRLSSLFNHSCVSTTRIYLSITKEEVDNLYEIQDMFTY